MLIKDVKKISLPETADFYLTLEILAPFDVEEELQLQYLVNHDMATQIEEGYGFTAKLSSEDHILSLVGYLESLVENYKVAFTNADREIFKVLRALASFDENFDDLELVNEKFQKYEDGSLDVTKISTKEDFCVV